MKLQTFSKGGVHVPENKFTPADRIIDFELPRSVAITLKQHIGTPAQPIVAKGDHVTRGQKIAEAVGRVSAPLHASISGTVRSIDMVYNLTGMPEQAILIDASDADHAEDMQSLSQPRVRYDWESMTPEVIIATIADAGVVGLGGATFPTAMKLSVPDGCKAQVLIINAAECEPYLTCDDALMRNRSEQIVEGIRIMMRAAGVERAIIGIEDNKPEAYRIMSDAIAQYQGIEIVRLKPRYPQGGEKMLIQALTGREVPSGGLPIHVGAIVQNVATAYAVYKAVVYREPLIKKVITIAGHGNYRVPIGIKVCDLPIDNIEQLEVADVVIGGPMMGKSSTSLSAPVEKGTSGVTVLTPLPFDPQPCIRCGECVAACPMGLEPFLISTYGRLGRIDDAVDNGVLDCIECGSCNFSCVSARPILDYIRLAKAEYRNRPKK